MIPKKASLLYTELSEELGLPENMIDNILSFYYKEVRKELTELNHPIINLEGLGQFTVKTKTVDSLILKYETMIAKGSDYTFSQYNVKKSYEARLLKLNNIKLKLQSNKEKKLTFFKDKNEKSI